MTEAEQFVNSKTIELEDINEQINEAQEEYVEITSLNTIKSAKIFHDHNEVKLKMSEKREKEMENELKRLQNTNIILIEKCKLLEQNDKDNEIIKQENTAFKIVYNKLYKLFPQEIEVIIQEIKNETQ